MEFDDIFGVVGEMGPYQIALYILLGLTDYFGYQILVMTFLGPDQDHWCEVDRLKEFPFEVQKYVGIPYNTEYEGYERCEYNLLPYDNLTDEQIYNWNWTTNGVNVSTGTCNSWVFDQSEFTRTLVSEYGLVCEDTYLVALGSTIYLLGILVASLVCGILSDKFGRKKTLLGGSALHFITAVSIAFAPNYPIFATLRFLVGVTQTIAYLSAFVMIMETIGPKYRTAAGVIVQLWFSAGFMLLPAFSYFVRDSRNLQLVLALPIIVSVSYIKLVPESPRWLVSQQRYKEANAILQNIAKINDRQIPEDLSLETEETQDAEKAKFTDLFTYPVLRKEILIIYVAWFTNSLVYFGLSLNTGTLVGNIFLNTFISGFVEVPANVLAIIALTLAGRRLTIGCSFLVAGGTMLLCIPFLDDVDMGWLVTTFTMIGKAAITVSQSAIFLYTTELFPTPVRNMALGSASMLSMIGGLVAPFMGDNLLIIWLPMPSVIFGLLGLISGVLIFFLPETLNQKLPDTMEDAKQLGRKSGRKDADSITVTESQDSNTSEPHKNEGTTDSAVTQNGTIYHNSAFVSDETNTRL